MKALITISALALVSSFAMADTFEYERQIGSQDLDPNIPSLSEGVANPAVSMGDVRISLHEAYRGNPDTEVTPADHIGVTVQRSTLPFTAYDKIASENPDLQV